MKHKVSETDLGKAVVHGDDAEFADGADGAPGPGVTASATFAARGVCVRELGDCESAVPPPAGASAAGGGRGVRHCLVFRPAAAGDCCAAAGLCSFWGFRAGAREKGDSRAPADGHDCAL